MAEAVGIGLQPALEPPERDGNRAFAARLERAIGRASQSLLEQQVPAGYWCAELEADTTLESDYIFYLNLIGRAEPEKVRRLANYIRPRQQEDGGWNTYTGGPSELNATVKAWLALRLAGDAADAAHLERAAQRIRELGGLEATNSFTRFYLALAGVIHWDMVPAIPPELMLLPSWLPVNLYEMSSWTRGIVVPLTILWALRPNWRLPINLEIERLLRDPDNRLAAFRWDRWVVSWRNLFLLLDRVLKLRERMPDKLLREPALKVSKEWMMEHLERSEGLAAIYPAMMNSIFALIAMGFPLEDPLTAREMKKLNDLAIEDGETIRLQPCVSPVWDTCIAMVSLEEAGMAADDPALIKAADWMLDKQVLGPGDWQKKAKSPSGGWAFEFQNDFYPDVDDTAFVLMALRRVKHPDAGRMERAIRRGVEWLLAMQNRDGGWGAFDKDNNRRVLTQIPFADHNAMIDPSTADVTARVVECLGLLGWPATHPAIARAREFLLSDQTAEGPWFGRWGVNYIYGTSGVLRALEAVGLSREPFAKRSAEWLRKVQKADGAFGETIASYDDPSLKGKGEPTPSQTAWALIGLLATAGPEDAAARRAAEWLLEMQREDGSWDEEPFTGTGFPSVFYLRYHLYRHSFPLYALARYRNLISAREQAAGMRLLPEQIERNGA